MPQPAAPTAPRRHSCGYLSTARGHLGQCLGEWPLPVYREPKHPDADAEFRAAAAPPSHEVRAWAKAQGRDVKDRGKIPADILEEYVTAHGGWAR